MDYKHLFNASREAFLAQASALLLLQFYYVMHSNSVQGKAMLWFTGALH